MWFVVIDAQTLEAPLDIATIRTVRQWTPGACVWCGDTDSVEMFRNEPRCGTCRDQETIIDDARHFLGVYGLRPLGGTLQSDDEEELEHRVRARDARRALNETRLEELPDPAAVRKALRPRAASVVAEKPATEVRAAQSTSSTAASRSAASTRNSAPRPAAPVKDAIDVEALQVRVNGLLDQLSAIDAQLTLVGEASGLAARARLGNLERRKATILRTLAALEKARLSAQQ